MPADAVSIARRSGNAALRIVLMLLVTVLAACERDSTPASPLESSAQSVGPKAVLSPAGYGPIKFGARLEDIEKALGPRLDSGRPLDPGCGYVRFKKLPGVRFMAEGGIITRADAEAGVPNTLNIEVGASLDNIRKARPEARIAPHKYDPEGHYVTFSSPDSRAAIVMEEGAG